MFKILVVEDDRDLNRTVCTFLNQSGYETTGCLNAADACDAMYDTVFDLIVSDIMMPDVDGFEFVKNVRAVMEQIRRLDRSVNEKGTVISIVLGVLGTLILGLGMSCALVWQGMLFLPGIFIGLAGIGILASAYPVYNHVTRKERERIAPEILRLTDELMK